MINLWLDYFFFFLRNLSFAFSSHILEIILSGFVFIVLCYILRQNTVSEGIGESKGAKCVYVSCSHLIKLVPRWVKFPWCNTTCFLYTHKRAKIWCNQYDRLSKSWNIFLQFMSKFLQGNGLVRFTTCFCDEEVFSSSADELSDYNKG